MSRIFRCSFSWLLWLFPCYSLAQDVSLAYGDQAFPPYQMGQGRLTDIEPGLAIDVVLQTAQMLGYDSTTAFITMFKKGLGQPPGQYLTGELLLPHN